LRLLAFGSTSISRCVSALLIGLAMACGSGAGPSDQAPVILSPPVSVTVTIGQTVTFSVGASGNPEPTFQWKKNSIAIPGAQASSYTTPPITKEDQGARFAVLVVNRAGEVKSPDAVVTVQWLPEITTQPGSQAVTEGQTATFSVVSDGSPAPTYQWQKDHQDIGGATSSTYTTPATSLNDSGSVFTVKVTNALGTTTSQDATLTVNPVNAAPLIASFRATPASILPGRTTTLSWAVTGADSLSLDQGIGAVTGTSRTVNPAATTTYRLTASNTHGTTSATVQVQVLPDSTGNLLGINLSWAVDWEQDRMFADIVKTARNISDTQGQATIAHDADGWPLASDFRLGLWSNYQMHGTYAISFKGYAASIVPFGGTISDLAYDAVTNTSTANYVFTDQAFTNNWLTFSGCERRDGSGQPGLTRIKVMRPIAPGSSQSYPTGTLFHQPIIDLVRKFQVVRFMDYLETNFNPVSHWSQRSLPTWASAAADERAILDLDGDKHLPGASLEDLIQFCNTAGRDAWINIPLHADDDYILKLAQLLCYGSDGATPYTSVQAHPVYPPLNGNLNVYLEYSNEIWNAGTFNHFRHNQDLTRAEIAAYPGGKGPLNYDDTTGDPLPWGADLRRIAQVMMKVSNTFRSVFGDDAMMTRVRPILAGQAAGPEIAGWGLLFMHNYYNNGDGEHVANPHPPNYYFYGAGGAPYYDATYPDGEPANLTLTPGPSCIWTNGTMVVDTFRDAVLVGNQRPCTIFGLKNIAYEGGPNFPSPDQAEIKRQADMAYRNPSVPSAPNMTDCVIDHHEMWSSQGGDLFVYYKATGDYQWGFAGIEADGSANVHRQDSPKLVAVDELSARPRAPLSVGLALPATIQGNQFQYDRDGNGGPTSPNSWTLDGTTLGRHIWTAYTFRADRTAAGTLTLTLSDDYAGTVSGDVRVYVDCVQVGQKTAVKGTLVFDLGPLAPGLHSLMLRAMNGKFDVVQFGLQQAP